MQPAPVQLPIDSQKDALSLNALKGLVLDGVHHAKSGHTGGAFSSMDFAYLLFTEFLSFHPDDPKWQGRDRFILSAGHESMLQYGMLHMIGWLPKDELKRFRRLHSKTPGHPENTITPGVECTTGPLGQGVAMSVGFAIAAQFLRETHDQELFNHKIYALCGDGDMQEDVTLGAASLAGHLGLGNLVWYYDRNACQISGKISRSTSDDDAMIYRGFGWEVVEVDGHDHTALRQVLSKTRQTREKPLLIIGKTVMGKGLFSMENDHETHGAPVPDKERLSSKNKFGFPDGEDFHVPETARQHFQRRFSALRQTVDAWKKRHAEKMHDANFAKREHSYFNAPTAEHFPPPKWAKDKGIATRNAFGDVIESWTEVLPNLVGGSADLEPSNMTGAFAKKVKDLTRNYRQGRNIAFGVREFPMAAICNGMALHGGVIPFGGTFLSFADYSRPALRLGAIQKVAVIHEFTHDSFYLGEDGPTHQPIEHVMSLRLIPNFYVMRPADAFETEVLMRRALTLTGPTALCLSRQKLPMLPLSAKEMEGAARGGYIVRDCKDPTMLILSTGSEVSLALATAPLIEAKTGDRIRVVSLPCWELFFEEPSSYRDLVIPRSVKRRISIEAGSTLGWERLIGDSGLAIGVDRFGESAPMEELVEFFGFTPEKVLGRVLEHKWQ